MRAAIAGKGASAQWGCSSQKKLCRGVKRGANSKASGGQNVFPRDISLVPVLLAVRLSPHSQDGKALYPQATSPCAANSRLYVGITAYELRQKAPKDLQKQLEDLKKELSQLRVSKGAGGVASKLVKITKVRKAIARVLTVYNHKRRDEAKQFFKGNKHKPKDLRLKKTRAIRQRLDLSQRRKMTVRRTKKVQNVPRRKYALLA
ncbi:60S ribosomal protein L35 [Cyclospora cayetanensis]|uniref:60S ribosomal protein L35 n=1 Tax=Cyclospora cayetanensis TaxID=88456 RepID=A0A6P6S4A2_9EIME|nr:60S ribosomal protein L35 [Cyclospora cayetanensis]